jgi:DNA repair exonuclease SbcCD ATPase subunit
MMTIKKLVLQDFGPIEGKLEIPKNGDFPTNGTICITGSNGIGKTHVTAAIKYLLTGKSDKKMCTYIHGFGRKEPNKTVIEGTFDYNGQDVVIKRTIALAENLDIEEVDKRLLNSEAIKTKTTASVKVGDSSAIRSATEVASIVANLTGLEGSTHSDAIFVDQNRAGKILHETPAELQKSLHSLSGAATCQKAVEAAQAMLPQLVVIDRTAELEDKKASLENIKVELADLDKRITSLTEAKTALPNEQSARETLYSLKKAAEASDKIQELQTQLATSQMSWDKNKKKQEEYEALTAELRAAITPEFEEKHKEANAYIAGMESSLILQGQRENVINQIKALTEESDIKVQEYEALVKPEDNVQELEEKLNEAKRKLQGAKDFLSVFGATGKCPTCSTAVENADQLIADNTQIVNEYTPIVADLKSQLTDKKAKILLYDQAVQRYNSWSESFTTRLDEATKSLDSFEGIKEFDRTAEEGHRKVIEEYTQIQDTLTEVNTGYLKVEKAVREDEADVKSFKARIADLTDSSKTVVQGDEAELETIVQQHLDLATTINTCTGEKTAKEQELNRCNSECAMLEAEQAQAANKLRAKKLLEGVKTVMHRSAIPHDISSLYVVDINKRLNNYCEKLKLPFTLFIHPDNLSFMAITSEATIPVSQLSGGQTTMAAWAWHLSLYEKHGKSFGMLLMDEPTTGVDEANMENIAEALRYMNEYCSGAGIQLMMITHETILIPCFTQAESLN